MKESIFIRNLSIYFEEATIGFGVKVKTFT